jgi:hypothetical protein
MLGFVIEGLVILGGRSQSGQLRQARDSNVLEEKMTTYHGALALAHCPGRRRDMSLIVMCGSVCHISEITAHMIRDS